MTTKLTKWGNSLGIRLPKFITDHLDLVEGSEIELLEKNGFIIISPKPKDMTLDALVADMERVDVLDQFESNKPVGKEKFWIDDK